VLLKPGVSRHWGGGGGGKSGLKSPKRCLRGVKGGDRHSGGGVDLS